MQRKRSDESMVMRSDESAAMRAGTRVSVVILMFSQNGQIHFAVAFVLKSCR